MPAEQDRQQLGETDPDVLVRIEDLFVEYRHAGWRSRNAQGVTRAVDGVSLSIRHGETLGLVGESGSGKSSLAKAVVRLERAASGHAWLGEQDLLHVPGRRLLPLRRRVQMVFQDSSNSLNPMHTVGQILTEPLLVHGQVPRNQIKAEVMRLAEMVGLGPNFLDHRPSQLSGGQRQRVNIARALAPKPDLLIADEPTSALDVSIQAQILGLLRNLQTSTGITLLLISHDLGVVRRMSRRVAVMYLGRVIEEGPREAVYSNPRHPYTQALLEAAPRPDPRRERSRRQAPIPGEMPSAASPPSGCRFHPRCRFAQEICHREDPLLRTVGQGHLSACHFAEELAGRGEPPADVEMTVGNG